MNPLSEKSQIKLDVKTLIGLIVGIVSIAGIWFSLTAEISQLKVDILRMKDDVILNDEFRIKWPRGEMGSLPADSKQDLQIHYLENQVGDLIDRVHDLEIKVTKLEEKSKNYIKK
jgi:hypothetical protein